MTDKTIADVLEKSIDKLSGGAAELAKAAKQVAPHAWEVAVRQQVIQGVSLAVVWFGLLASIYALVRWGIYLKRDNGSQTEDDLGIGAFIIAGMIAFLAALAAICGSADVIGMIFNPEYYAARAILGAVK